MRCITLAIAGAVSLLSISVQSQSVPPAAATMSEPLTLAEAWRLAEAASPTLRTKQAQFAAAEGLRTEAAALLNRNPELSAEGTRRSAPQPAGLARERQYEWNLGVSQALEIAGQSTFRRTAAAAGLDALRAEVEDVRRQIRSDVAQQFYRVLTLQERLEIERQALALFEATAAGVEKRRAAGEDTRLDANFAVVEAERARSQLALVADQLLGARGELATRLQLKPDRLPAAIGDAAGTVPAARHLLDDALSNVENQPRLRALAAREESARARLGLERARRYPDVTVGIHVGREGPAELRERLTTLTVSVPLPLFNRNAAAIGQATTDLAQTTIERQTIGRNLRSDVYVLRARLQSLEERVQRLRTVVLPRLEDNVQLSLKSRSAGQIGLLELILVNRQVLDARRELNEALNDYHATRLAFELAAGLPIQEVKP